MTRTIRHHIKNRARAQCAAGAVLVEDRVDYPEGTELELDIREPVDDLDDKELVELDEALEAGEREYEATGKIHSKEEVLARLRTNR